MASDNIYKIVQEIFRFSEQDPTSDISTVSVSFSNVGNTIVHNYIYFGNEKIPFNNRHPEYQKIFMNEFTCVCEHQYQ
jgi:hypothetical protein